MQRTLIPLLVSFTSAACFAALPATQPQSRPMTKDEINAAVFHLLRAQEITAESPYNDSPFKEYGPVNPTDPLRLFDFDITYRPPPAPAPVKPKFQGYLAITKPATQHSGIQNWRSFQFNNATVWNRPAIYDSTLHAVQDTTTGKLFYYRDFANTVEVPLASSPQQVPIGAGSRHTPYRGLDLLDDRSKPQK